MAARQSMYMDATSHASVFNLGTARSPHARIMNNRKSTITALKLALRASPPAAKKTHRTLKVPADASHAAPSTNQPPIRGPGRHRTALCARGHGRAAASCRGAREAGGPTPPPPKTCGRNGRTSPDYLRPGRAHRGTAKPESPRLAPTPAARRAKPARHASAQRTPKRSPRQYGTTCHPPRKSPAPGKLPVGHTCISSRICAHTHTCRRRLRPWLAMSASL